VRTRFVARPAERPAPGADLAPAPCPLCGSAAPAHVSALDRNRRTTRDRFDYHRCRECGLVFLWPVPDDLARHYPDDYHFVPASRAQLERLARRFRDRIDLLRRHVSGRRLLEIGPAYGAFAHLAVTGGFDVETIEMDARCCRFLAGVVGARVIESDDPAAAMRSVGQKDAIVLWHVLEHLRDPWGCLGQAAARLVLGGVLLVAVPNPQALQFRIFGGRWAHLDAPRHLSLPPAGLLRDRLGRLGLRTELVTASDPEGRGWDRFGWRWSVANLSGRPALRRPLSLLGLLLAPLAAPWEARGGRGSTYTAVFRKVADP